MRTSTTDLYEGSYLHASGVTLSDVRVDRGRSRAAVVFIFDGDDTLVEKLQHAYHSGDAVTNVADYRRSLSRLRQLIHDRLNTPYAKGSQTHGALQRNRANRS